MTHLSLKSTFLKIFRNFSQIFKSSVFKRSMAHLFSVIDSLYFYRLKITENFRMLGFIAGVRTMLRSAKEIQEKQMVELAKDEKDD